MSRETMVFLGQCMNRPEIITDTLVRTSDFVSEFERRVFEAIKKIHAAGYQPTFDIVAKEIGCKISDTMDISNAGVITANWQWYETAIIEQSKKHQLKLIAEKILKYQYLKSDDIFNELAGIDQTRTKYPVLDTAETVDETIEVIKARRVSDDIIGVPSGLRDLDKILFGFQDRRLYYIGARPGVGKTMLLLNFLADCGVPAGFMSLESSYKELTIRLLARQSFIDSEAVALGHLSDDGMKRVEDAANFMKERMQYEIYDEPNMDLYTLIAKAWQMKRKNNIKILFIDYLQAINYEKGEKKCDQVQAVSKALKDLAREMEIPIVVAAQLRRDAEGARPKLNDFSDSTQVERDADVAIMMYRDEKDAKSPELKNRIYLLVEKNRDGKIGDIPVWMNPDTLWIHC